MEELENIDEAAVELSIMLHDELETPTPKREFLDADQLDYSVSSLNHLEDFLSEVDEHLSADMDYLRVVLRTGSYLGEVIKRSCKTDSHWLDYDVALKLDNDFFKNIPKSIAVNAVLKSDSGMMCFPYSKIISFFKEGYSDYLKEYAQGIILVFDEGLDSK